MARPTKKGLDYFPLDVNIFDNPRVAAISGEFQLKGEIVLIKLLCAVYKNGYFYEWSEINRAILLRQLPGVSPGLLDQIVERLVRWGFFDKSLFDSSHVLTSAGIQERYFAAISRRKKVSSANDYPYLLVNVCNNPVNVCRNYSSDELMHAEMPQIKGNEIITPLSLPTTGSLPRGYSPGGGNLASLEEDKKTIPAIPDEPPAFQDGIKRNYSGLLVELRRYAIPDGQLAQIILMCNYGEIGHPVWKLVAQLRDLGGKIKMPGQFILSRLEQEKQF